MKDQNRDIELRNVLLECQIAVNRDENIKVAFCLDEEFTVV